MLTKRGKAVLDYIEAFTRRRGYAPSLEEIRKHFRLASASTAHFHVVKLKKSGYLKAKKRRARSLMLVADEHAPYLAPPLRGVRVSKKAQGPLPLNRIVLGDALEGLRTLPPESVDVAVADPPYNIGKDFGNNIDKRELQDYLRWCMEWISECVRVMKPSATLFIYGFSEILAHVSVRLPLNHRWLIWHYTNKNVASLHFWQRSHEAILCAWKEKPLFHRDEVREPYTEGFLNGAAGKVRKGTPGRYSRHKPGKPTVYNAHDNGALPRDVLKIPALAGGAGINERWFLCRTCGGGVFAPRLLSAHEGHDVLKHPTQKPLELSRRLIASAAPRGGGVVLVPFAGSGAECAAARALGHDYVGFEINPDYVRIAEKAVEAAEGGRTQASLFA